MADGRAAAGRDAERTGLAPLPWRWLRGASRREAVRRDGPGSALALLAGERGHYARLAGEGAEPYLRTMAAAANRLGLIREQVWDGDPLPRRASTLVAPPVRRC